MNNRRVSAWIDYHRSFSRTSPQRLALAIGKSDRTLRTRMNDINSLSLGECKAILEELKCDKESYQEFFREVMKAWEE